MPGTPDTIEPSLEEAERIDRFWDEHHREYLERYPEQFVAVLRSSFKVVAFSDDLARLVGDLRKQGLNIPEDVVIEFIRDPANPLLL